MKYVVTVDRSFWFNPAPGGVDPRRSTRAGSTSSKTRNPVTPRAFFTARSRPAGRHAAVPGDDGTRPAPGTRPSSRPRHSIVEGSADERSFSTDGTLGATFDGDRVGAVDPSVEERFLVLNELYHPAWQPGSMASRPIYPTNLVMRGIVVPPAPRRSSYATVRSS